MSGSEAESEVEAARGARREAMRRKRSIQPGFTLIEAVLAAAVLTFVVAALTQAIAAGQGQTYAALHANRGVELAEALMDEALSRPWLDPDGASTLGPEDGEAPRSGFDNLDDYHGYTESAGTLTDPAGEAYGRPHQRFSRAVQITATTVDQAGLGERSGLEITVTVTDERGRRWVVRRFVAESGASSSGEGGGS